MSSADPHQVPIGTILEGKFRLTQEIGRGGMAAVFEAENIDIGKRVAVKLLSSELITSRIVRERFIREARAAAAIHSPYICQVFDSGMYQDRPFLVMELLLGESLYDHMSRVRQMDAPTLLRIIRHVTRGLEKAHEAGVVHRDLKPENIFLTQNDDKKLVAKILDFGLAKFYENRDGAPDRNVRLTREGALFGTPAYMSPEQARGQGEVDYRADLWALACITYECLTGTTVWDVQQGVAMILAQIARGQLPDPRERRPDLPPSFVHWFQRALHPDLNQRYQTASEFYQALDVSLTTSSAPRQSTASGELFSASTTEPRNIGGAPATNPPAKRRWRALGALLSVAALVFGAYAVWLLGPSEVRTKARSVLSGVTGTKTSNGAAAPAEIGPGADAISEAQELLQNDQPREALRILAGAKGERPHVALSLITHAEVAMDPQGPCQLSGLGRPRPFDIVAPTSRPTLALGKSGLLLAWSDAHENPSRRNVYVTLLDDALRRVGPAHNASPEAGLTISPLIAPLRDGFVLSYWDSGASPGVFARRISSEGQLLSPQVLLSAPRKDKYFPSLLSNGDELWALWSEAGPAGNRQITAQVFDANLKPLGVPRVLTHHEQGDASEPVGQLLQGELIVAYQVRFKNSDSEVHLATFSSDALRGSAGTPAPSKPSVLLRASPKQAEPNLSCAPDGCLVVWDDETGGAFAAFVPRGAKTPLWHREFSSRGKRPALGRARTGEVVVAYYAEDRVMLAPVTPSGIGESSVISKVSGFQPSPHVISGKADGEWYLAWRDFEAGHLEVFVAQATCKTVKGP